MVFCNWCYLITLASCALLQDEPRHIGGFGLRHCNNSLMMDVVVSNIPKAISELLVSTMHAHLRTHSGSVFSHLSTTACGMNSECANHQHSMFIITKPLSGSINQQTYWLPLNDPYCTSGKDKCSYFTYKHRNEKEVFIHKVKEYWIKTVVKSGWCQYSVPLLFQCECHVIFAISRFLSLGSRFFFAWERARGKHFVSKHTQFLHVKNHKFWKCCGVYTQNWLQLRSRTEYCVNT